MAIRTRSQLRREISLNAETSPSKSKNAISSRKSARPSGFAIYSPDSGVQRIIVENKTVRSKRSGPLYIRITKPDEAVGPSSILSPAETAIVDPPAAKPPSKKVVFVDIPMHPNVSVRRRIAAERRILNNGFSSGSPLKPGKVWATSKTSGSCTCTRPRLSKNYPVDHLGSSKISPAGELPSVVFLVLAPFAALGVMLVLNVLWGLLGQAM